MGSAGFTKVLAARLGTSLALAGRAHDEPVLCNAEVSRRFETGLLQVLCRFAAGLLQNQRWPFVYVSLLTVGDWCFIPDPTLLNNGRLGAGAEWAAAPGTDSQPGASGSHQLLGTARQMNRYGTVQELHSTLGDMNVKRETILL